MGVYGVIAKVIAVFRGHVAGILIDTDYTDPSGTDVH